MRQRMNGRGLHPKIRDSSFRFWSFDDAENTEVRELIGGSITRTLGIIGANSRPEVLQSMIGTRSRSFNRLVSPSQVLGTPDASADSPTAQGEFTLHVWLRFNRDPGTSQIFGLSGDGNDETQAHNAQIVLRSTAGNFGTFWENGAGSNELANFIDFDFVIGRWYFVTIRKAIGASVSSELLINGESLQIIAGLGNADGGTDPATTWRAGARLDGTTAVEESAVDIASAHFYDELLTIAEIKEDFRRGYLLDQATWEDFRVEIEDGSGNMRDLTDLEGVDFVEQATTTNNIDAAVKTGSVTLSREASDLSLAPTRTESKLNLSDVDVVNSFSPLIAQARAIEFLPARVPLGVYASGLDWNSELKGQTDKPDWSGEAVKITVRDQGGRLVDTSLEDVIANSTINTNVPPEKYPSYGSLVGQALELAIQDILDDNDNDNANNTTGPYAFPRNGSYEPITLVVDGTPTYLLLPWSQTRVPTLSAIRNLAGQIGWECKYRPNDGLVPDDDASELTLFVPDRERVDSDLLLTAVDIIDVNELSVDVKGIRNVVRIAYLSSEATAPTPSLPPAGIVTPPNNLWSGLDGEGGRLNAYIEYEDTASIDENDRHFMEIGEASSSQIDTIIEAERMCLSIIQDLATPNAEMTVVTRSMFQLDLSDMGRFQAIRELFTINQKLALVEITNTFGDKSTSAFKLRGKPAVGFKRWLALESKPGQGRPAIGDPLRALADSQRGPLLRILRELNDGTSVLIGGKYLRIPSESFQQFSAGNQNPPDSWMMVTGAWPTDMRDEGSIQISGQHSIAILNTTGEIQSPAIGIDGDGFTPYSFELRWQRSAAVARAPRVLVDFFTADKITTVGGTTTLEPGGAGAPDFPAVPATASTWFTSRVDGIHPPAGARYLKLSINGQGGSGAATIYADKITGYRTSRASKAGVDAGGGAWGTTAGGAGDRYNQRMGDTTFVSGFYDRGLIVVDDHGSPANNNGYHVLCREPGTYEIEYTTWLSGTAVIGGAFTADLALAVARNATYDVNGLATPATAADVEIVELRLGVTILNLLGAISSQVPITLTGIIEAKEGDRISPELIWYASTGNTDVYQVTGTAFGALAFPNVVSSFSAKLRGLD